jgi:hypothetical protein
VGDKKGNVKGEAGRFVVSPTLVAWGTAGLLVAAGVMAIVWGPVRVKDKWEGMEPEARAVCEDVVVRGLECHLSAEGSYDPSKGRGQPGTKNLVFDLPLAMSMPARVKFNGMSTSGGVEGWYFTETGEVEAEVELGATVLPTGIRVRQGDSTVRVTGRRTGGEVTVEVDGKPGRIVNRRAELKEAMEKSGVTE